MLTIVDLEAIALMLQGQTYLMLALAQRTGTRGSWCSAYGRNLRCIVSQPARIKRIYGPTCLETDNLIIMMMFPAQSLRLLFNALLISAVPQTRYKAISHFMFEILPQAELATQVCSSWGRGTLSSRRCRRIQQAPFCLLPFANSLSWTIQTS